jgi:hypothetical protein
LNGCGLITLGETIVLKNRCEIFVAIGKIVLYNGHSTARKKYLNHLPRNIGSHPFRRNK